MEFQQVNTIQSNTHLRQLVDDHIPTITSAVSLSLLLPSKTFFEEPDDDMLLCLGKKRQVGLTGLLLLLLDFSDAEYDLPSFLSLLLQKKR